MRQILLQGRAILWPVLHNTVLLGKFLVCAQGLFGDLVISDVFGVEQQWHMVRLLGATNITHAKPSAACLH